MTAVNDPITAPLPGTGLAATTALTLSSNAIVVRDEAGRFRPATLQARIHNLGQINDQFNVTIDGLPAAWVRLNVPGVRMRPGLDDTVDITIAPPRAPESRAGQHRFRVRVTPQEQPAGAVEQAVTLEIPAFTATTLDLVEPAQPSDGRAVFRARLANGGNVPLRYQLAGQPAAGAPLAVAIVTGGQAQSSTVVMIEPGQEALVDIQTEARPAGGVEPAPGAYGFSLQATAIDPPPALAAATPPLTANGTVILSPPRPVRAEIEPDAVRLVDLLAPEATTTLRLTNPSRHRIGLEVEARAPAAAYDIQLATERVILEPESEQRIPVTVRRAPLAAPVTAPQRLPFQLSLRPLDPLALSPADGSTAPLAAPGSIALPPLPPVDVLVLPPGLAVELAPRQRAGAVGQFRVIARNRGSQPAQIELTVDDPGHELEYAIRRPVTGMRRMFQRPAWRQTGAAGQRPSAPLTIEPQQTAELEALVRPARSRTLRRYAFTIGAAINGQPVDGATTTGELDYQPRPRRWLVLLGLLLALMLLVGGMMAPGQAAIDVLRGVVDQFRREAGVTISQLDPGTVVAGQRVVVRVRGAGFAAGAVVQVDGQPRQTQVISATEVRFALAAGDVAQPGRRSVSVVNPDGAASNAAALAVEAPRTVAPRITGLAPTAVRAGSPGFTLTIAGTDIAPGAEVRVNGQARPTRVIAATRLLAAIDATDIARPGAITISIVNPDGSASNEVRLTISEGAAVRPALVSGRR